jgi:hypothetical protein
VFLRISEIDNLINACADHRVNYVTLALSGPVSKCHLSHLLGITLESYQNRNDIAHRVGLVSKKYLESYFERGI